MSELKFTTRETIEELFGMETGYVIDFSNSSFQRFVKGIKIGRASCRERV